MFYFVQQKLTRAQSDTCVYERILKINCVDIITREHIKSSSNPKAWYCIAVR